MRRAALRAAGVLLTLAVLLAGFLAVAGLLLRSSRTTSDVYRQPFSRIALDLDNADVSVEPGPEGQIRVVRELHWSVVEPKIEEHWESGVLRVRVRCALDVGQPCRVSYRLGVPPGTPLLVKIVGGDASVRDTTGPVGVDSGAGDVHLTRPAGDVSVMSRAGEVRVMAGLSRKATVDAHSGDVLLDFAAPPASVDVRLISGNLAVQVPTGSSYAVDARTVAGAEDVSVADDTASGNAIHARLTAGDLTVRYGSPGWTGGPPMPPAPSVPPVPSTPPVPPVPR